MRVYVKCEGCGLQVCRYSFCVSWDDLKPSSFDLRSDHIGCGKEEIEWVQITEEEYKSGSPVGKNLLQASELETTLKFPPRSFLRHNKTDKSYVVIGACYIEAGAVPAYMYMSVDGPQQGVCWVRPVHEMEDGRFSEITQDKVSR